MRKQIIFLFFSLLPIGAMAVDSSWLLCKGTAFLYEKQVNLVVNAYEHRDGVKPDGTTRRSNDIIFIFGGHELVGRFDSTESDSSTILLKNHNSTETFNGTVIIDYPASKLQLKGDLTLFGDQVSKLNVRFSCEELN